MYSTCILRVQYYSVHNAHCVHVHVHVHVHCTCTCTMYMYIVHVFDGFSLPLFHTLLLLFLLLPLFSLSLSPLSLPPSPSLPLSLPLPLYLRFTKPRQFSKSDNNGSESPPGERRSFSTKRSPFVMSAGTGGRRRSFSFKVEEQRRNEGEGFSTSKVSNTVLVLSIKGIKIFF